MSNSCETDPTPKGTKEVLKTWKFWKPVTAIAVGSLLGFLYYYFVGCASGTCGITSSPVNSTLYFAILGGLIVNLIKPETKNSTEK